MKARRLFPGRAQTRQGRGLCGAPVRSGSLKAEFSAPRRSGEYRDQQLSYLFGSWPTRPRTKFHNHRFGAILGSKREVSNEQGTNEEGAPGKAFCLESCIRNRQKQITLQQERRRAHRRGRGLSHSHGAH